MVRLHRRDLQLDALLSLLALRSLSLELVKGSEICTQTNYDLGRGRLRSDSTADRVLCMSTDTNSKDVSTCMRPSVQLPRVLSADRELGLTMACPCMHAPEPRCRPASARSTSRVAMHFTRPNLCECLGD